MPGEPARTIEIRQGDSISPVDPTKRFGSVDAVRGFALFGVLLVNMFNFGADFSDWSDTLNRVFSAVTHALFETKSLRLFSLLFGLGFAWQMSRVISRPGGSLWFTFRRLVILFAIGMAHALLFDGDILMEYAILGLILIAFRNARNWILLLLTCLLLAAFPVTNLFDPASRIDAADEHEDSLSLAELREDEPYLGSLIDVFKENVAAIPPPIWTDLGSPESSLTIFSMLLLGLYVGRSGIIEKIEKNLPLIRRVFVWGMSFGCLSAVIEWYLQQAWGYAVFHESTASAGIRFLGDLLFAYGSTALALSYGAGIVLLSRKNAWRTILQPFQNMGRMALTIYLSGSLMFTTLFYGYGFGQLYLLGPAATFGFATVFFVVLMLFSNWWLSRFRFGPVEWVWRSLTYMRVQPLRLDP